jgi:hypothetical protein
MTARIDALRARIYRPLAVIGLAAVFVGCAAHRPPPAVAPVASAPAAPPSAPETPAATDAALERATIAATAPRTPLQLVYGWTLQERDGRFSGKAAARVEPPDRARLDLFGPRGDGYLSAAVVGSEVRVPEGFRAQAGVVPAPPLLWTALGTLHPPEGARLTSAARSGDRTQLAYARGSEKWHFDVVGARLRHAEMETGANRYTVDLKGDGPLGLPKQAVYRDYADFRELTLTLDQAHEAQPFPPDTWTPGGH